MALDPSLSLPRILCLHGGGVNATVFRLQGRRVLVADLAQHFRLVFADGPFLCPPHPAISLVYGEFGPFYRWLRFQEEHEEIDSRVVSAEVVAQCRTAMESDAGSGEWVGVLGFSQGAKIAASLLWAQERPELIAPLLPGVTFRFGVLMAGSAPIVMLDPTGTRRLPPHVESPGNLSMAFEDFAESNVGDHAVGIPTLHVHGLQDPGIDRHRKLMELYCKKGTTKLVEWNGDHRLPIKTVDVDLVINKLLELARETGVF